MTTSHDINERNILCQTIDGVYSALISIEGELTDEQIFFDVTACRIDQCNTIGAPEVAKAVRLSPAKRRPIKTNQAEGHDPFHYVVEATVQRARPVVLTALAAVLAFRR